MPANTIALNKAVYHNLLHLELSLTNKTIALNLLPHANYLTALQYLYLLHQDLISS